MKLSALQVRNYKSLEDISLPLSRFVCLIGQNNAGKSSILQALLLFIEGRKLSPDYYYDPGKDITIRVTLDDIAADDLAQLAIEHRQKLEAILKNGTLTLIRRYAIEGTSRLRRAALVPSEVRFTPSAVETLIKGKKPSRAFAEEVVAAFPELKGSVDSQTNATRVRELINELGDKLSDDLKHEEELDLPSGIDNSIRPLLPEPIYIPAVKDLADEIKTKDGASFGKLLSILLDALTPDLANTEQAFASLNQQLNRIVQTDGTVLDNRLEAVKQTESLVEKFVQESFSSVRIRIKIPPPELKTILATAEVWADDGVDTDVSTKGDGLKRAVTFSILRSYVELKRLYGDQKTAKRRNYLFLFEEPELYLHPSAQKILFEALQIISRDNRVLVSTHSPLFFGPDAPGTFAKVVKRDGLIAEKKPFAAVLPVDLMSLDNRERFQVISFETNNIAFFGSAVVLVEGDTDQLVFGHVARLLKPEWSVEKSGITVCRVSGKGSFRRYREFFEAFEVDVSIFGDLDCLLDSFAQLELPEEVGNVRNALLEHLDKLVEEGGVVGKLSAEALKKFAESPTRRAQWEKLKGTLERWKEGKASQEELQAAEAAFFSKETMSARRSVLEESTDAELISRKRALLSVMRRYRVYVLEKGSIEKYFPPGIEGKDKPSRALNFISKVRTREEVLKLCAEVPVPESGGTRNELELIFAGILGLPSSKGPVLGAMVEL